MLVWINGPFGVGKTTAGKLLADRSPRWRPFDPELVGSMLTRSLLDRSNGGEFQDLSAWRHLVPIVAREISDITGQQLIAAQTVLIEGYWTELQGGLRDQGFEVLHVLLDVDPSILSSRIKADASEVGALAMQWRLDHVEAFEANRTRMTREADLVVDASASEPDEVVAAVLAAAA